MPAGEQVMALRHVLPAAGSGSRRRRWRLARSARTDGSLVLGVYLLLSMVYIGRHALPSPAAGTVGTGPDVQIFLWGFRWWPYALEHGVNPFVSHVVWAPFGSNILWTTTVPALSLLTAPLTLALGPSVTWNVLSVLAPALSGWGTYLLCRELTGRTWPAAVGGAVFGFSSYALAEGLAHLQAAMVVCVPLAAWLVVRHLRGRLSPGGLALRLGALAVIQFLISPEILATAVLFGAITLTGAAVLLPEGRRLVTAGGRPVLIGLAGAGLLLSPLVVAMLLSAPPHMLTSSSVYSSDLANLVVPTRMSALGVLLGTGLANQFLGNLAEQCAYLGLPLLLIIGLYAGSHRRQPLARLLMFVLLVSLVLSLGPRLTVAGHPTIWLPGALLAHIPLIANALPARFTLYAWLATAVIVALWLDDRPSDPAASSRERQTTPRAWRRPALAALALLAITPTIGSTLWWKPTPTPIASGSLGRLLPTGSNVLSLPFWNLGDRSLYAQATSGMRFNLIDSWLQLMPAQFGRVAAFSVHLSARSLVRLRGGADVAAFERSLCRLHVHYVVVWNYGPRLLAALGIRPRRAGPALVYRMPACSAAPPVLAAGGGPGERQPAAHRPD